MAKLLGVDVGGTFTDLILVDTETLEASVAKVPTTLRNQSEGVLNGLEALQHTGDEIDLIVHGTTTGTNALLERQGARAGLITSAGFRDVLEVGRRTRPHAYGLSGSYDPLVSRELRLEVEERVLADGTVHRALDLGAFGRAVEHLLEAGAESIAVCFLHSYANDVHESQAAGLLRDGLWPNSFVSISSEIAAEFREFERMSTVAVNAYLQPLIQRYVSRLADALKHQGYRRELMIMKANGGLISAADASDHAVYTVLSGPAAGGLAAARVATSAGYPNAVSCDMGGTSFDVVLISSGLPTTTSDKHISYNVPVRIPVVDVHAIGAGGGSIASVDAAGLLKVGPDSAGSEPGPVAFGRGGTEPTIADADVLLGRLPRTLLGVEDEVDIAAVEAAMLRAVGEPLGLGAEEAAQAILRVANHAMAGAIRHVSIERGHDPRDFAIIAFGGAGPLHAVDLAIELAIPTVIVPYRPGITSALGCVVADVRHDFVQTINTPLRAVDPDQLRSILEDHVAAGRTRLEDEAVALQAVEILFEAELQYEGQTHVVGVQVPSAEVNLECLAADFAAAYHDMYGVSHEIPERLVNLRTTVTGTRTPIPLSIIAGHDQPDGIEAALLHTRPVWFPGGWVTCPIYQRELLASGDRLQGPAILQQQDSTTVVHPGSGVLVDEDRNLIITVANHLHP